MLDSNYQMHYYKDKAQASAAAGRPMLPGSIDLAAAYAASAVRQGLGIEIATPGRTWVFLTEDRDAQACACSCGCVCDYWPDARVGAFATTHAKSR